MPTYTSTVPSSSPDRRRNADADAVAIGARSHPSRAAVIDADGAAWTYRDLDQRANRIAQALHGLGVHAGERVAIWLENRLDYIAIYIACLRVGAVIVQVNHRHTAHEARYQLEYSGADVLFFDDTVSERVAALGVPLRHAIALGSERPVSSTWAFESLILRACGKQVDRANAADDVAALGFTSGTTGYPKAAELTHSSIRTLGDTNMVACRYTLGSVQVYGFSLSFTAGIPAHILPHLRVGGTTVLLRAWDTERLVREVARHGATFTLMPSPPISDFCEIVEADPRRVASLVSVLHSTARAPESHLERLVGAIGPRLVEGWGMTENSGGLMTATTMADYASGRPRVFSTAGRAVPGTEVRAIDENGGSVPEDGTAVGLLEVRTLSLARGYWRDADATTSSFRGGWFSTGDLGSIDEEGYVYLVDRRSDLIVSGGMNVYPSEVERVLAESADVAVCAVVGAPHERWGRTPVAFVVPTDPRTANADALLEFARRRLASYKLPTQVHFVPELPTNAGGKILRRLLTARLEGAT